MDQTEIRVDCVAAVGGIKLPTMDINVPLGMPLLLLSNSAERGHSERHAAQETNNLTVAHPHDGGCTDQESRNGAHYGGSTIRRNETVNRDRGTATYADCRLTAAPIAGGPGANGCGKDTFWMKRSSREKRTRMLS